MAERSAVNRQVLGSIPSGGAFLFERKRLNILSNWQIGKLQILRESASRAPLAERSAVNRQVLGSIPSGGVFYN